MEKKLKALRRQQDLVNKQLTQLLIKRIRLAFKIMNLKTKQGLPIFDSQREDQILAKLTSSVRNKIDSDYCHEVFKTILKETKSQFSKQKEKYGDNSHTKSRSK